MIGLNHGCVPYFAVSQKLVAFTPLWVFKDERYWNLVPCKKANLHEELFRNEIF